MAKMRKKSELPTKLCAHCQLPFTWRKKWERDWEQVKYCSERCRLAGRRCAGAPHFQDLAYTGSPRVKR